MTKAGDPIAGLSKRLFVLILAMVIAGFAIPSPGVALLPNEVAPGKQSPFKPLATPSVPQQLIVPAIKLRAPVLPIDVNSEDVLVPPADVSQVGWWRQSAKPGSSTGQTVITGHTVHTGGGVMNKLGQLAPGELVQVSTRRGTVDYRVTKVFVYTREQLAKNALELFDQRRPKNRLVLITCTGWTGSEYTSNIIVLATPLGVRKSTVPLSSARG